MDNLPFYINKKYYFWIKIHIFCTFVHVSWFLSTFLIFFNQFILWAWKWVRVSVRMRNAAACRLVAQLGAKHGRVHSGYVCVWVLQILPSRLNSQVLHTGQALVVFLFYYYYFFFRQNVPVKFLQMRVGTFSASPGGLKLKCSPKNPVMDWFSCV